MATMKTLNGYGFNATELNGIAASGYLQKTDTAADSSKLGGQLPAFYATAEEVSQIKDDIGDAWVSGTTYAVGDYCISGNQLYKCKTAHTSGVTFNQSYWEATSISDELSKRLDSNKISFVTKTVVAESNKTKYNLDVNRSQYVILSIDCVDRYGWEYNLTSGVSGSEGMENWALIFYDQPSGTYNFKLMLYKI